MGRNNQNLTDIDWSKIPPPEDDGAADHLINKPIPAIYLLSTDAEQVDISSLTGWGVVYIYPMTGRPDTPLPDGWDAIPGARGCTPQSCSFRDEYQQLLNVGVDYLFGLSTQDRPYQQEAYKRLHLPFPLLSDAELQFANALKLPIIHIAGMSLLKRMTLIIFDGVIKYVFYPIFPPHQHADEVIHWFRCNNN